VAPFGSLWLPLAPLWLPLAPSGSLWLAYGFPWTLGAVGVRGALWLLLAPLWLPLAPSGSLWLASGFPWIPGVVGVRGSFWLPLAPLWLPLAPSGLPADSFGPFEQLEYGALLGSFVVLVAPFGWIACGNRPLE
jgi:hypothetical protein